jgi:hypothetical protein
MKMFTTRLDSAITFLSSCPLPGLAKFKKKVDLRIIAGWFSKIH